MEENNSNKVPTCRQRVLSQSLNTQVLGKLINTFSSNFLAKIFN